MYELVEAVDDKTLARTIAHYGQLAHTRRPLQVGQDAQADRDLPP